MCVPRQNKYWRTRTLKSILQEDEMVVDSRWGLPGGGLHTSPNKFNTAILQCVHMRHHNQERKYNPGSKHVTLCCLISGFLLRLLWERQQSVSHNDVSHVEQRRSRFEEWLGELIVMNYIVLHCTLYITDMNRFQGEVCILGTTLLILVFKGFPTPFVTRSYIFQGIG